MFVASILISREWNKWKSHKYNRIYWVNYKKLYVDARVGIQAVKGYWNIKADCKSR